MSLAPLAATSLPDTGKLLDALRRGDQSAAEDVVRAFSANEIRATAEGLMRRRRWSDAAWLFARLDARDAATEMKRCLARNLAAMQVRHPDIYRQLIELPTTDALGIANTPSGRPTVLVRRADGSVMSLAGGPDPLVAAANTVAQVRKVAPNGEGLGLCGMGDGHLLQALAQNPPALFMDMQQAVFVFESEPQIVLHALMIHDFGGDDGPIAAARFRWFVGPNWLADLNDAVERNPALGVPGVTLQQGPHATELQAGAQAALQRIIDRDAAARREAEAYYATLTPGVLADVFGDRPSRAPRVLLLTTRFSTVLQFSTRDTADAFRALGWDAQVLIEPSPSHRMYQHVIRRAIADFRPDLFFQIDHLRREHRDLIPANLPFVCWGQDHLPNLITPDAGRRVGELDFVLTDNPGGYARNYEYPARQLIATSKLTVAGEAPEAQSTNVSNAEVDDVVFVSNASRTPQQLLGEAGDTWDGTAAALNVLRDGAGHVMARYFAGNSIATYSEIRGIVRDVQTAHGVTLTPEETLSVSKWLTHPFNDALYRQQALRWAVSAAKDLGLSLGLYGKGWDAHPEFAAFARGPVAYGEPLRELTRRAAINLQIVPYLCLHQRLLDGLAAGGFFLVRQNPNDVHPQALLNFLDKHCSHEVRTTAAARAAIALELRREFERLVALAAPGIVSTDAEDPVALIRDWADAGNLQVADGRQGNDPEVLPRLREVSFDGEAQLRKRLTRFARDPHARRDVASQQRTTVLARLSYTAGMDRVRRRIAELLRETAREAAEGIKRCA